MNNHTLRVNCDINIEDIFAWNDYFIDNDPEWKRRFTLLSRLLVPLSIFVLILGFPVILLTGEALFGAMLFLFGALGLVYCFTYPRRIRKKLRKNIIRNYSGEKTNHECTVSPTDGIRDISDSGENVAAWDSVESIEQTKEHLFILARPQRAFIIPRRAFADEVAFYEFGESLKELFRQSQTGLRT